MAVDLGWSLKIDRGILGGHCRVWWWGRERILLVQGGEGKGDVGQVAFWSSDSTQQRFESWTLLVGSSVNGSRNLRSALQ